MFVFYQSAVNKMIMIIITLNIIINNCDNINVLVRAVVDKCQMNATLAVSATGGF